MPSEPIRLFHFSLFGLLGVTTAVALVAAAAAIYPTATLVGIFLVFFTLLHVPELFLRYFPRTTLLCLASVGCTFIGGAIYGVGSSGEFNQSFFGRLIFGSLILSMTGLFVWRVRRGEV